MSQFSIRAGALGLALAFGVASTSLAQAAGGVIVVNTDRVLQESAAGKYATSQLRPQVDQFEGRRRAIAQNLQTEQASLEAAAKGKTATEAVLQQRYRELQQHGSTGQTELQAKQRTIQATQQWVVQQINDGMNPIVTAIMKEKGATVAIPTGATLQVSTAVDVTRDVISRLDRALPRVSMIPPAAPAAR